MNRATLFGLLALIPAALNTTPASAQGGMITVPICTGDGQVHLVTMPLGRSGAPAIPGSGDSGCCVKGCHGGSSRKRSSCHFDQSQ